MSVREDNNRELFQKAMSVPRGELYEVFNPSVEYMRAYLGADFEDNPTWISNMQQVMAENRMCECGVTPPGWDKLIWCQGCADKEGVDALARPFSQSGEVVGCPWCHTNGPA